MHDPAASGEPAPAAEVPPGRGRRVAGWIMASRLTRRLGPHVFPPMHRLVMRLTGGRTMLDSRAQPMLMLATTGAKSGKRRETPLATVPRAGGTYLVVGSNFARESHPAWTANLLAEPRATITVRGQTHEVVARLLTGADREACWHEALRWYPGWEHYDEVTDRQFRMFELTPIHPAAT